MKDGHYYWGGNRQDSKELQDKIGDINLFYKEGVYISTRWYKNKMNTLFFWFWIILYQVSLF